MELELNSLPPLRVISPANPEETIGKRVIGTRWVLKRKGTAMKAELVVQDFNNGLTDASLYASTSNMSSLRAWIALASWRENKPTVCITVLPSCSVPT